MPGDPFTITATATFTITVTLSMLCYVMLCYAMIQGLFEAVYISRVMCCCLCMYVYVHDYNHNYHYSYRLLEAVYSSCAMFIALGCFVLISSSILRTY